MNYNTSADRNRPLLPDMRVALALIVAIALALGAAPNQQLPRALAATAIVVSPDNLNGWAFDGDGTTGGTGSIVAGPATPPLGSGSAHMTLDGTTTSRELLRTFAFAGTRLDQITKLEYSTYRSSADAGNNLAISLQFDIDYDLTDSNTAWQGRLVFEPYQATGAGGTIVQNTWQTWNPLDTNARWWASGAPGNTQCPQNSPCSWAQVLNNWPNAGLRATIGGLQFKAGGPAPSFNGNVDGFTIGVNSVDTTFDFELDPRSLTFSTQPGGAVANSMLSPQPVVTILEEGGNPLTSYNGPVTIALGANPAGGVLSGTTTVNAVNGVATFAGLSIDKPGTGYSLIATSSNLPQVSSTPFTILSGPATQLTFSTQPGGAAANSMLSPQPVVTVKDAYGNTATSYNGPVTIALGANPAGGVLSGTTTVNAVNGVATFADLSIDKPGTGYSLIATSSNLPQVSSTPFTILSGPATQLTFSTQPGGAVANGMLNPQPVVTVKDAYGNTATSYNGPVTIALGANPAGGTLSGTTTVNAVNGVATFADLSIDKPGTGYTLAASATGLSGSTSTAFTITAALQFLPLVINSP